MKRLIKFVLLAFAVTSCIYPFEPDVSGEYSRVVIDGNIILGGVSSFTVTRMQAINASISDLTKDPMSGSAWIEVSDGTRLDPITSESGWKFIFDTEKLPENLQYCFHFKETVSGKEYVSAMESLSYAPEIDDFHYDVNENDLELLIDLSSDGRVNKCRWDFKEIWEYMADFTPDYEYNERSRRLVELSPSEKSPYKYYYCWDESNSVGFGLADMGGQTEIKAANRQVTTLSRSSKKLSSMYKIELTTLGMSEQAYEYYSYMKSISDLNGDLFSPNPSEVRGNVRCLQDPDEFVAGYVSVATSSYAEMWIGNGYYKKPDYSQKLSVPGSMISNAELYEGGNRPAFYGTDAVGNYGLLWGKEECVDCRGYGGTKDRPENWPTHNY